MSDPSAEILSNSAALHALKRPQLNRLCKRFGVTAKGKNTELIERLENLAGGVSKEEFTVMAGAPEESPMKKARTTDGWELVDSEDVENDADADFGPSSPTKSGNQASKSSSTIRSLASTIKNKWKDISPSKQSTVSPSKYQDVCVEMNMNDSSDDEDDQQQQQLWNVVPGECQPTRLSTAASIHPDTITDDTVKLVGDNRPPSPSPSFVSRQSLPGGVGVVGDETKEQIDQEPEEKAQTQPQAQSQPQSQPQSPSKIYPQLPQFVFGQQTGVTNAGFTSIMDELNRRLPTAEIKPEVQAQAETSKSPKSAEQLGLKSTTNLKIKRKFDDAHESQFKKMDSIADHYAARPRASPTKTRADSDKTNNSNANANAKRSSAESSQPNKRIKVAVPTEEEKEKRDEIKRRLEKSRQRRRSSMAANARGRPSARASIGGKPVTRLPTASKAAGLIKSVGKRIFGGATGTTGASGSGTTNARASTSAGGSVRGSSAATPSDTSSKPRVVKKLKKAEQPPPRTSSLTKPTPFSFASVREKPAAASGSSAEPTAQAVEAQQRAAERVKMARLKESNKGGKGTPVKRRVNASASKRPSQAEQVSKARMSQSPVKRGGRERGV
ncbi:hypothetical protein E3P99_02489 [Wallemia hederae]|uniref:SAP domain-containing protein n=1 Tax=Wallemia hederae TaxID=1540922 RepID=A0A4T0FP74_9BASI|nr:hypothetical protein E3P99_02489 [Wallemia hederae]